MKPDLFALQVSCSGLAGAESKSLTPAFCWVRRSQCIRDFLLLYRDQAVLEHNVYAEAHLNGLLSSTTIFEKRCLLSAEQEISAGSSTPVPLFREGVNSKLM